MAIPVHIKKIMYPAQTEWQKSTILIPEIPKALATKWDDVTVRKAASEKKPDQQYGFIKSFMVC
jgi:hypothetical protein